MKNILTILSLLVGISASAANYPVGGCHQKAAAAALTAAAENADVPVAKVHVHSVNYLKTLRMNPPTSVYEVNLVVNREAGVQYQVWTRYSRGCKVVKVELVGEE